MNEPTPIKLCMSLKKEFDSFTKEHDVNNEDVQKAVILFASSMITVLLKGTDETFSSEYLMQTLISIECGVLRGLQVLGEDTK